MTDETECDIDEEYDNDDSYRCPFCGEVSSEWLFRVPDSLVETACRNCIEKMETYVDYRYCWRYEHNVATRLMDLSMCEKCRYCEDCKALDTAINFQEYDENIKQQLKQGKDRF